MKNLIQNNYLKILGPIIIFTVLLVLVIRIINLNSRKNKTTVLGETAAIIENVSADRTTQPHKGSPLVFGGAHTPSLEHQDAWNLIGNVGITMIRRDFLFVDELPKNITLDDYKNNVNGVADVKNWNKISISSTNKYLDNIRRRGMKAMGIIDYAPLWLTYSGTRFGVPKDFDVYKDLVKKQYRLHRQYLDLVEVWNEPNYDFFLDLTNSPFKTRADAYYEIYKYAYAAIKEVDREMNDGKQIPIIAIAGYNPTDTSILTRLLDSKETLNTIEAVSYHNYKINEPSDQVYRSTLKKYGKDLLPIYITEWNSNSDEKSNNPNVTTDLGITYTAKKLISFLNMGIEGANYFSLTYNSPDITKSTNGSFGFYRIDDKNKTHLLPMSKTWKLLSKSLGLGKNVSQIYDVSKPEDLSTLTYENTEGDFGVAMVNDTNDLRTINLNLANFTPLKKRVDMTLELYMASSKESGDTPCSQDIEISSDSINIQFNVPPQTLLGIRIIKPRFDIVKSLEKILAISTSSVCVTEL